MCELEGRIRYSEVNSEGKLTILSLMDYFQDCSVFQSASVGMDVEYLSKNNMAWMLVFWQIKIVKMPKLGDKIKVHTWAYDMKGFYGYRNFAMTTDEGEILAKADSIWILVDTKTGRPKKISKEISDFYEYKERMDMEEVPRKINLPEVYEDKQAVEVPAYFIDTNNHMNNTKYVMVALEYVPKDFEFDEVRVEYRKEAVLGDMIYPKVTQMKDKIIVSLAKDSKTYYANVCFIKKG